MSPDKIPLGRSESEFMFVISAAGPAEQLELVGTLLKELSHSQAGERGPEERRGTLLELLKVAREDSLVVWEEHFKTMLLLLLETLGDKDVRTQHVSERHMCRKLSDSRVNGLLSRSTRSGRWPCES